MDQQYSVQASLDNELRNRFAGLAMQALIAKTPLVVNPGDQAQPTAVSMGAYEYADAMMKARTA